MTPPSSPKAQVIENLNNGPYAFPNFIEQASVYQTNNSLKSSGTYIIIIQFHKFESDSITKNLNKSF